jgi:putative DNA primase/helicase
MTSFADALRIAGLLPRDIEADGRLRRCPTKTHPHRRNGWYVLHMDGNRGVWGDNAVAPRQALGTWNAEGAQYRPPTAAEQERQRRARDQQRQARLTAMRAAAAYWTQAKPCGRLHPYLDAKGLQPLGTTGLRQHGDALVVPVVWRGRVISVQTIRADGTKRFWPGAPVKAGCFEITRQRAAVTVICEGLATGLAVFQAVRNARVVVAFDAGNLMPVVDLLRPTGSVVLAADNDHGTMARLGVNPGLDKARNAAELIGAGVAYPQGIEGTDFADWLKEGGALAARRIERAVLAGARYVPGA